MSGVEIDDTFRSNSDIFISLDTSGNVHNIEVSATSTNKYFSQSKGSPDGNEILMMYESFLEDPVTSVKSTSRVPILFRYFIFVDCSK